VIVRVKKKQKENNKMAHDKVCEIKLYRDNMGRTIRMFVPINGDKPFFTGIARIRVVPVAGDSSTPKEKDFEFPFPIETLTIEQAFTDFDNICQKRVDENNTKLRAKLADNGGLPLESLKS
jgi:hypothetical protein